MTLHEGTTAEQAAPRVVTPGTNVGGIPTRQHAIVLGDYTRLTIEGNPDQLRALLADLQRQLTAAAPQPPAVTYDATAFRTWLATRGPDPADTAGPDLQTLLNALVFTDDPLAQQAWRLSPRIRQIGCWCLYDNDTSTDAALITVTLTSGIRLCSRRILDAQIWPEHAGTTRTDTIAAAMHRIAATVNALITTYDNHAAP